MLVGLIIAVMEQLINWVQWHHLIVLVEAVLLELLKLSILQTKTVVVMTRRQENAAVMETGVIGGRNVVKELLVAHLPSAGMAVLVQAMEKALHIMAKAEYSIMANAIILVPIGSVLVVQVGVVPQ